MASRRAGSIKGRTLKVGLIGKGEVEIDNEGETVEEGEPHRRSLLRLPTGITGWARVEAGDRMGS